MNEIIAHILIAIGIVFNICGCIGLVRFPDVYNRLQAATKCVTLGTILLLVGVAVSAGISALSVKAIICAVFVLITSPTAAHAIAKGSHAAGIRLWENSIIDKYDEEKDKINT